jgi:uncharacterized membrane protein YphA (DoxX/SURF4 family)
MFLFRFCAVVLVRFCAVAILSFCAVFSACTHLTWVNDDVQCTGRLVQSSSRVI